MYVAIIPAGGNTSNTILVSGTEISEGPSFSFCGKLIEKSNLHFSSSLNLLFPKMKVDKIGQSIAVLDQSTLRAGWQNRMDFNHCFAQLNVLADINHLHYVTPPVGSISSEKHTEIVVNYLLLGYRPPLKAKSLFSDLSIFVQLRNLFASKYMRSVYKIDQYGGLGVNVSF